MPSIFAPAHRHARERRRRASPAAIRVIPSLPANSHNTAMRLLTLSALALAAETAYGYLDTSPFFMFSTSELLNAATKISTASAITSEISQSLSHCPSDYYILVSQPGVTADDYRSRKTHTTLAQRLTAKPHSSIRSSVSIPEVIGDIDLQTWMRQLTKSCHVDQLELDATGGSIPTSYEMLRGVITVHLAAPLESRRQDDLSQNDALIASLLDMIPSTNYTVLYTTTPAGRTSRSDLHEYVMDSEMQDPLHTDLKRDLGSRAARKVSNQTVVDGPLFHKYQFFTPGIFMGFFVGFLLLMILYVGVSALSSLSVTYAAFDKEQGQLAAKKMQ